MSSRVVAFALLLCCAGAALAQPVPVAVAVVEPAAVGERFSLTGTLTAERAAALSPRVDGLVKDVHVDAGDEVSAGDALLSMDDALARHALARAQARSAEAEAAVEEARRLFAEAERVGRQNFIPATQVATREAEVAVAEAALASVRAAEREQAELVARHVLPAPFDGVVAERLTESGEWVQRGTPVLRLVALDRVRLDVQVPQERWQDVAQASEVTVHPDALPDMALPARIEARVPVTDAGARTFLLRITVEAGAQRLMPGTSARVEVSVPADGESLVIPRDALLRQPDGGYSVFVVTDGEAGQAGGNGLVARQRTVRVAREQGTQAAIASGLSAGERVVVRGNEALRDGQAVRITEQ